ncbi:MAG TPA: TonB-dependent receptor [Verrucomicrobiae bacterium]|nr:TonB-dependent receptor [Verrucomicrobiae bacterium]
MLSFICLAALAKADGTNQISQSAGDLENFTLEQLVNVQVTSVSKKETGLFTAPAAIYVITQEDIRRSGLTSIPELLRMVPGLDVARIDANHWAISARGFNNQYADKLLVLIDGRSVYTPVSAGVDWNVQDTPLEDIDRIEVIRGPGATLWGANAVNGVINIITKSAKDTQGGLVTVTYGTEDRPGTTVRYGGQLATNLFYRVYVKYFNREHFADAAGQAGADDWNAARGGFRLDWEPAAENNFTLQGDYYHSDAGETIDATSLTPPFVNRVNVVDHNQGGNVLGRWTHNFSDTSQLSLQAYYDHTEEGDAPSVIKDDTYDIDLQHRFALGTRQDIVWGAGYRYLMTAASPSFFVTLAPGSEDEQLFSTFVQDDITAVENRLHVIIGTKLEHNTDTGFEVEPSGRLAWTPTEKQTVWAAVSRAVRTPSDLEMDIRENRSAFQPASGPPVLASVFGNPDLQSEEVTAYELGYRIKPVERLSFDVTAFYNTYDRLITAVQGAPFFEAAPAPPHIVVPLTFQNSSSAATYGTEILGEWRVTDIWKLVASYALLQTRLNPEPVNNNDPQNQFQIHSYVNLPQHVELDAAVYYVDAINAQFGDGTLAIPAYVRVDLGVTWRPTRWLEIGVYGQNLTDDSHPEMTGVKTTAVTEVPRSVMGRVTWRF